MALNGTPSGARRTSSSRPCACSPATTCAVTLVGGDDRFEATIVPWDEFNGRFYTDIGMKVSVERPNGEAGTVLMVEAVRDGSAAHDLGVLPGDIIPAVSHASASTRSRSGSWTSDSLETLLDQVPPGTEIEIDAYRDLNGDGLYQRPEQLKGVLDPIGGPLPREGARLSRRRRRPDPRDQAPWKLSSSSRSASGACSRGSC